MDSNNEQENAQQQRQMAIMKEDDDDGIRPKFLAQTISYEIESGNLAWAKFRSCIQAIGINSDSFHRIMAKFYCTKLSDFLTHNNFFNLVEFFFVPNWLIEVLAWITRIEMANSSLSYSCKLFKLLCWPKLHENVRPHKIEKLEFPSYWSANCGHLQLQDRGQPLPIPRVPPPPYILGFNFIDLGYPDEQVLEFLQNILHRLNPINFPVNLRPADAYCILAMGRKKDKVFGRLLDLLANKIVRLLFDHNNAGLFDFNQLFPKYIQKIYFLRACPNPTAAEFDILFDWLTMPPTNAGIRQKILELWQLNGQQEANKFIDRIKEKFSDASAPLNFYIVFPAGGFQIAHFNMENGKTGEILKLAMPWQIVRCPKGEKNRWIEEGQKKTDFRCWIAHPNETYISYNAII